MLYYMQQLYIYLNIGDIIKTYTQVKYDSGYTI